MTIVTIDIRKAKVTDAAAVANVHYETWKSTYQGIIPYSHLAKMIARRDGTWWEKAIKRGTTTLVVDFGGKVAGYATIGLNRARTLPYDGEVYELYVLPEYQGIGLGSQLLEQSRKILSDYGLKNTLLWVLEDNIAACDFYAHRSGRAISKSTETFSGTKLRKIAYAWDR